MLAMVTIKKTVAQSTGYLCAAGDIFLNVWEVLATEAQRAGTRNGDAMGTCRVDGLHLVF